MSEKAPEVNTEVILYNLNRIGNQIFRTLPTREEGLDWVKPLETLSIEIAGLTNLYPDNENLLTLLCKIKGLLSEEVDFLLFRRTIFECCSLTSKIKKDFSS